MANSKKLSSSFLIGLFVMIGSALIVGAIIWLGANQFLKERRFYATYFVGSVEGLEKGRPVKYLGVPVGNVAEVRVAPDGKLIEIIMQIDKNVELNDSLRVKSEMANIAGGKFLQLFYPSSARYDSLCPKLNFTPQYPVIKSAPSGFDEIEIAAREIIGDIKRMRFEEISDQTINFLETTSNFFANDELFSIITKVDTAGSKANSILSRVDTAVHQANRLLARIDSMRVINNINVASDEILQTAKYLKTFSEKLDNEAGNLKIPKRLDAAFAKYDSAMISLNKALALLSVRADNVIFNASETIYDLKNTQKQLRKALRAINESPSQTLFSEPPPYEK